MLDDAISHDLSQAMPGIAGEHVLAWDDFEDGFSFVVQHSEAADVVLLGAQRGISQPFLDFLPAPVILNFRGAADDALDGEIVLMPQPAEHEEGKTRAPGRGHDNVDLWARVQNTPELDHTIRSEDMRMFCFARIQHPVNVEEDNVK